MLTLRNVMFDSDVWWVVGFKEDSRGNPYREVRVLARCYQEALSRAHLLVQSRLMDPSVRLESAMLKEDKEVMEC